MCVSSHFSKLGECGAALIPAKEAAVTVRSPESCQHLSELDMSIKPSVFTVLSDGTYFLFSSPSNNLVRF
jgi:hypothetical protein